MMSNDRAWQRKVDDLERRLALIQRRREWYAFVFPLAMDAARLDDADLLAVLDKIVAETTGGDVADAIAIYCDWRGKMAEFD